MFKFCEYECEKMMLASNTFYKLKNINVPCLKFNFKFLIQHVSNLNVYNPQQENGLHTIIWINYNSQQV